VWFLLLLRVRQRLLLLRKVVRVQVSETLQVNSRSEWLTVLVEKSQEVEYLVLPVVLAPLVRLVVVRLVRHARS